jgi:hypothetical protein
VLEALETSMTNPYDPAWQGTPVPPSDEPAPATHPAAPSQPYQPYQPPPPAAPWASPATPYEGAPAAAPPPAYPYQQPPPYQQQPPPYQQPYQQQPPYQGYPPAPPGYPPPYGQGYGPYGQPPVKKKSRVGLIIGIVAGVVVLCLAVSGFFIVRLVNGISAANHVVVEVTGQGGPAQITIVVGASTVEDAARTLPYTYTYDASGTATEVSVRAAPVGAGGSVGCRILVGGVEKAKQTGGTFARPAICLTFL